MISAFWPEVCLRLLVSLGALALMTPVRADGQEKKPALPPRFATHITLKAHRWSLPQCIAALDKATEINILMDGEPRTLLADVEIEGTLAEALDKVADAFDYKWKMGRGEIVLLNKRFQDRDQTPQATPAEIAHLVTNMRDIFTLARVDPDSSQWPLQLDQLGQSLTDQQWTALLDRKRIPASDLTPQQFQHLRAAVLNNTFADPLKTWVDLAERLRNINTAYMVAHRLPKDPDKPAAPPAYTYEFIWHNRDGSLSSEPLLIRYVEKEGQEDR